MTESILNSTKKILGIAPDYKEFDLDILTHINSVFSILQQLGVGPVSGFMILDDTETWDDFLGGDLTLNAVKTYVYMRVRLLFDPPTNAFTINALKEQVQELEWRMYVTREMTTWVDPNPAPIEEV